MGLLKFFNNLKEGNMKKIEAIIRPMKVGAVCEALEKVGHPGVTVSEIEGHGNQKGVEQQVRGQLYKIPLLTKAKLDVIAKDKDVKTIVKAIRDAAFTGEIGDGKIFVLPVDNAIRIRTDEEGDIAI